MSIDEKITCGINVAFGAAPGFAIYFFALGGYSFLLMPRGGHLRSHLWRGVLALQNLAGDFQVLLVDVETNKVFDEVGAFFGCESTMANS